MMRSSLEILSNSQNYDGPELELKYCRPLEPDKGE